MRKTFDVQVYTSRSAKKSKIDNIYNVSRIVFPNGVEVYNDIYDNIQIRIRNHTKNVLFGLMDKLETQDKPKK